MTDKNTINRVNEQIDYHDNKSISCQRRYKFFKSVALICAALITFCAVIRAEYYITALISLTLVLSEGFLSIGNYHELWINHRRTCEKLKSEKQLFIMKSGPYDCDDPVINVK